MGQPLAYGRIFADRSARQALVLLAFVDAVSCQACNGNAEFCVMPLDTYVWPGTHNSGSSQAVCPNDENAVVTIARCFYDNHARNFQEQLHAGIRLFSVDMCVKNGVVINCHRNSEVGDTEGEPIGDSLLTVKTWLEANPQDVVVWRVENDNDNGMTMFESEVESLFGSILWTNADLVSLEAGGSASLGCLHWPGVADSTSDHVNVSSVSLGRAIAANTRFVYASRQNGGIMEESYTDALRQTSAEVLQQYFLDIANGMVSGKLDVEPASNVHTSLMAWVVWYPDGLGGCRIDETQPMNEGCLPSDASSVSLTSAGVSCPFRSNIEIAHQILLDRGYRIGAVLVDYSQFGDLIATVGRLNVASWRRLQNSPEPCASSAQQGELVTSTGDAAAVFPETESSTTTALGARSLPGLFFVAALVSATASGGMAL